MLKPRRRIIRGSKTRRTDIRYLEINRRMATITQLSSTRNDAGADWRPSEKEPGANLTKLETHANSRGSVHPDYRELRESLDHMNLEPVVEELTTQFGRMGRRPYARRPIVRGLFLMPEEGITSVSELVRRLGNESNLRAACGFSEYDPLPSVDTFRRVRRDMEAMGEEVESRIMEVLEQIKELIEMEEGSPGFAEEVAVDATTIRSNSNGNRKPESDPDADWGIGNKSGAKSGKSWTFGFKFLTAGDANHGIPLYLEVVAANVSEKSTFIPFMEEFLDRGFEPKTVIADRGYDSKDNNEWLQERGIAPVIHKTTPKSKKHTRDELHKDGFAPDGSPLCGCGIKRVFLRTDDRGFHVYGPNPEGCPARLPNGQIPFPAGYDPCGGEVAIDPKRDVRLFGGDIRRGSPEWDAAYRKRWSVERVFSRWKGRGRINEHHLRSLNSINLLAQLHMLSLLTRKLIELKEKARARAPDSLAA